jgi:hypothetical protein
MKTVYQRKDNIGPEVAKYDSVGRPSFVDIGGLAKLLPGIIIEEGRIVHITISMKKGMLTTTVETFTSEPAETKGPS